MIRRLAPLCLAAALACVAAAAPADEPKAEAPQPPAVEQKKKEDATFARLFSEGVEFMKQGRAHEALTVFEAARKRQPKVPEVPTNTGFIHLAAKKYDAAARDFEEALIIEPRQVNAYWGLAMAMEGLGDLEVALGAMRTYAHLEKEGSPFQRKAYAAIWEWEEQMRVKRGGEPIAIPPGAVTMDGKPITKPEDLLREQSAAPEPEKKP